MIEKKQVIKLAEEAIKDNEELFLIDVKVGADSNITVIADGDRGISINDCIGISRYIEQHLDRDTDDFSLEVTSPGATEPFVNNRQYRKNIGRTLKVVTEEQQYEAILIAITDENITLEWKTREPKELGKGKQTVTNKKMVPYGLIKSAKVKIKI